MAHRISSYLPGSNAVASEPVAHSLHNDGHSEESNLLSDFRSERHSFTEVDMTQDDGLEARPPILHVGVARALTLSPFANPAHRLCLQVV